MANSKGNKTSKAGWAAQEAKLLAQVNPTKVARIMAPATYTSVEAVVRAPDNSLWLQVWTPECSNNRIALDLVL